MTVTTKLVIAAALASVQCCKGYTVEGVRPDGRTWCVGKLACPDDALCGGDVPDPPRYPLAIYCTNGQIAIVIDERTVGCQARH